MDLVWRIDASNSNSNNNSSNNNIDNTDSNNNNLVGGYHPTHIVNIRTSMRFVISKNKCSDRSVGGVTLFLFRKL